MKRICALLMISLTLLCAACGSHNGDSSSATNKSEMPQESTEQIALPHGLAGDWSSASAGERGYSEMISFGEDGSLTVSSLKDGVIEQTIYGTFYVEGNRIIFNITGGATPYSDEFEYSIEGRELYLIDDDGPAQYLRTS